MGKHEKLLERLRSRPKDFRWEQLKTLLSGLGYVEERGRGSRRRFFNPETGVSINLHQPHPRNELKSYQVNEILDHLKQEGLL
jgi:predicted RNA binding protein YcfA (HicA-like mRNA interferase family)